MGKMVICSTTENLQEINQSIVGFVVNGKIKRKFGILETFSKLRIETKNVYVVDNSDDFVAGVGTFVYKNSIGEWALKKFYEDFSDSYENRNEIYGSYCIAVYKGGKCTVFVDPASTYSFYYHLDVDNVKLVATNTFYHVAKCVHDIFVDPISIVNEWTMRNVGSTTMFKDIYRLQGNQFLKFYNGRWNLVKLRDNIVDNNIELAAAAMNIYKDFPSLFHKSGIFMTGGQDSRLSLALMLALKMKPTLYYGIGDSSDTATKNDDLKVVKEISDRFNLPMITMNWNNSNQDEKKDYYLKKYGEHYSLYSMNCNFFDEFESKIDTEFITFGYFGEVYRAVEEIEEYRLSSFTLDNYVDDLYLISYRQLLNEEQYSDIRSLIRSQFLEICSEKELDENGLTKDDFQKLNTAYRQRWDTIVNNFSNQFFYSCPLFGDSKLTTIAENIPFVERKNSKYQMRIISHLLPEILSIPIFSHVKIKRYNPVTYELVDKDYISIIKERIRACLHSERSRKFARKIYYFLRHDEKGGQEVAKEYEEKKALKTELKDAKKYIEISPDKMLKIQPRQFKRLLFLVYLLKNVSSSEHERYKK